ncbi:FMN-binding protein [Proteiniclasticum ruminis]|uniref:Na+-translocating ferredoxin:NAD+ oxidoreductase RNF, RnfG subunit n=1 Tax=Proteiniclasticum ruminis TaxID=398199 RepID=A0A1G8QVA2_9CLOT|nr:FMN-binding protein [Proteiniclasticum ruminis]SDJ08100.1 Na+-translocating ferredoxin:NAD+ oxidoreductase RNF, RnfG subunit [Proteiniclasticum ruminis]
MKNMKGFVVLLATVLVAGGVLLFADAQLRPLIEAAGSGEYQEILEKIFPDSKNFEEEEFTDETGLIQKLFEDEDNGGFVYILENQGFADKITFALGFDLEGNIVGYEIINLNDTPGYGSQVGEEAFIGSVVGKTSVDGIATISGSTKTSKAVVDAIDAARANFNEMMGIEDNGEGAAPEPVAPPLEFGAKLPIFREDVSESRQGVIIDTVEEGGNVTYTVEAAGYAVIEQYDGAKPNVVKITLDPANQVIVKVEVLEVNDTKGIGDKVLHEDFAKQFENLSYADPSVEADTVSMATISSTSVINAILAALNANK